MTSGLQELVLYSDIPFGFIPRIDLSSIHFPNLRSLTLGHFSFSHKLEFDWIVSHSATLRSLSLDHCFIIPKIEFLSRGWLDEDGYPNQNSATFNPEIQNNEVAIPARYVTYATRWHHIFDRFTDELQSLRHFRFGTSWGWDPLYTFPRRNRIRPLMPFDGKPEIQNRIFNERYQDFTASGLRFDSRNHMKLLHGTLPCFLERLEWIMCNRLDHEALARLLLQVSNNRR